MSKKHEKNRGPIKVFLDTAGPYRHKVDPEWRRLCLHAVDNLGDLPISEEWATRFCRDVLALLEKEATT